MRYQLMVTFVVISVVLIILVGAVFVLVVQTKNQADFKNQLYSKANTVSTYISANTVGLSDTQLHRLTMPESLSEARVIVIKTDGNVAYDSYGFDEGRLFATTEVIDGLNGQSSYVYLKKKDEGIVVVPIKNDATEDIVGVVAVMDSFNQEKSTLKRLLWTGLWILSVFVVIIIIFSYYLSSMLVKPFTQAIEQMNRVTEGHFDEVAEVGGFKEIDDIVNAANHMIRRLKSIEENHQQFVANVSHELKTPLSSMKVLSDSLLGQEQLPDHIYQEFLADISKEVDRETMLINDLLTLARIERSENMMEFQEVSVNELLETILSRLKPLANRKGLELFFESRREVVAEIDEIQMTLALTNIMENAIKYNKEEGFVHVTLDADHQNYYIEVKDSGIGIPQDALEKIFTRFYRVDKTRSRETGGTGLGLSISKQTILSHKGSIRCKSLIDKGTSFYISLPLHQRGLKEERNS